MMRKITSSHQLQRLTSGQRKKRQVERILKEVYEFYCTHELDEALISSEVDTRIVKLTNEHKERIKGILRGSVVYRTDWQFASFLMTKLILLDKELRSANVIFMLSSRSKQVAPMLPKQTLKVPGTDNIFAETTLIGGNSMEGSLNVFNNLFKDCDKPLTEKIVYFESAFLRWKVFYIGPKSFISIHRVLQRLITEHDDTEMITNSVIRARSKCFPLINIANAVIEKTNKELIPYLIEVSEEELPRNTTFIEYSYTKDYQMLQHFATTMNYKGDLTGKLHKRVKIYLKALFRSYMESSQFLQFVGWLKRLEGKTSFLEDCNYFASFLVSLEDFEVLSLFSNRIGFPRVGLVKESIHTEKVWVGMAQIHGSVATAIEKSDDFEAGMINTDMV